MPYVSKSMKLVTVRFTEEEKKAFLDELLVSIALLDRRALPACGP